MIRNPLCWGSKAESGREGREGGGGSGSNQSIKQASKQAANQARDMLYLAMRGREVLVGGSEGPRCKAAACHRSSLKQGGVSREKELENPGGGNSRFMGRKTQKRP